MQICHVFFSRVSCPLFVFYGLANQYSGTSTYQRAKELAKFVCFTEVLFSYIILFYYYWAKENYLLYLGLHYIEVHYIEVPLCRGDVALSFLGILPKALG